MKYFFLLTVFSIGLKLAAQDLQDKKLWIDEFKYIYFADCLKHGFGDSKEILAFLKQDKSAYPEMILGNRYKTIDSIAVATAKKITLDSIQSYNKAEENQGKKIFRECLCNYTSDWLDKLAKKEYNKPDK